MNKHSKLYKEIIENKKAEVNLNKKYILQDRNEILKDLEMICSNRKDIIFFYETIKMIPTKLLEKRINDFVYFAIYGNSTEIYCFTEIILSIDKKFLTTNMERIIIKILDTINIDDGYLDYLYLNIVSLYQKLGEDTCLKNFLINYCKQHEDMEIQEIYKDYI